MVIALLSFAFGISLSPLIALIAGILILIMPRLLNYIVAIYLIIIGRIGLFNL
jgi:threonine/homoserine efflux transporter RhtA